MNDITPKEAIANLNHIYGMVSPDIQRSLDVAIKALERLQGDAISRAALKEEIVKSCEYINANNGITVPTLAFTRIIDNAPTVEITEEQAINKLHETGWLIGHDKEMSERPQGEWIEYNATGKKQYMCSECSMKEKNPKIARYCYWCGAKMKGGSE